MKRSTLLAGLGVALSLSLLPALAHASCGERKTTGTVIGGIGGALIGNSISRGGGGAVVGGLGGAVLGHEIAGSGCGRYARSGYDERRGYYRSASRGDQRYGERPRAVRYVYYDQYGNPVAGGAAPYAAPVDYRYAGASACRTEMHAYYDERGSLIQRPIQVCAR